VRVETKLRRRFATPKYPAIFSHRLAYEVHSHERGPGAGLDLRVRLDFFGRVEAVPDPERDIDEAQQYGNLDEGADDPR
jgi:hypothetical protein